MLLMPMVSSPGKPNVAAAVHVVQNASYQYPSGVVALREVDLHLRVGETLGVVGPSGCGKSTLLQLLAGFVEPTSGAVVQLGQPRGDRHAVAMVFQKDTVLPWLTVEKNIGLVFRFVPKRMAKAARASWIDHLLELGGLTDFRYAYPYQLSGGMRRRVAFLTGVAAQPELLLLDEPFSALDEPTRVGIHQSIHAIVKELGMTVVIVTHDLEEAISLCDEVAMLSRRPGTVVSRHRIPFGDERNMLDLREDAEFLALYAQLWHELSEQISLPS